MVGAGTSNLSVGREDAGAPVSVSARVALVAFSLAAGLGYRAGISLMPDGLAPVFVLALAAVLLGATLLARNDTRFRRYWLVPFAFFVFAVAGFFGDGAISPLQHLFVRDVLHESTSANNPLASSVTGTLVAQVVGTVLLAIPILALTRASGADMRSIFLSRPTSWWGPAIGVAALFVIYFLALRGRTESFFPTNGPITSSRILSLTPALIVLVLLNGFREELWFRALFLNKYAPFLGPVISNVLAAVIFTSFHVQVSYSASLLVFLAYALLNGLILGWLMQTSKSIVAPMLFHAATDIPIFLVYLTYAS